MSNLRVNIPAGTNVGDVPSWGGGSGWGVAPQAGVSPSLNGFLAWNGDPINPATNTIMVNGTVYVFKVPVPYAMTISTLWCRVQTIGATFTGSQNFMSLYSGALAKLAEADASTAWGTVGARSVSITPQAVTAGFVYVAMLANATTPPIITGFAGGPTMANLNLSTANSRVSTHTSAAQTATPATLTLSTGNAPLSYWVGVS